MRQKAATDRTMGLAVEPESSTSNLVVRRLQGQSPTREINYAIKTQRIGPKKTDKLTPVQIRWLIVVHQMLTNPPKQDTE